MQILLANTFEVFTARSLGLDARITTGNLEATENWEAQTIEDEFRGLTWHNLIYYHHRWDKLLSCRFVLTDDAYVEVLPSFICACLIWDEIDSVSLAEDLLAPITREDCSAKRFEYMMQHLSA